MSGFDSRLVFTFQPRDSTLQYKRCVHLCIITLIEGGLVNCLKYDGLEYI